MTKSRSPRANVQVATRGPDANAFLIGSVAILCLLGLVMVYSATMVYSPNSKAGGPAWADAATQALFLAIGVGAALLASKLPARFWNSGIVTVLIGASFVFQAYLALARIVGRLSSTPLPLVMNAKGGYRWLGYGPVTFQPSDVAKLALILWVARTISENRDRMNEWEVLKRIVVVSGSLCVLVLLGNDLGTTLLLFGTTVVMLLLGGAPTKFMIVMCAVGALVSVLALTFMGGFRMDRIKAFWDPSSNPDKAMQAEQSTIGFASGGLFGTGPGTSRQKWGYLPEADTDFIFSVVGEELGVVGTVVVLGSYATFMAAAVTIAARSKDSFCRFVGFGVASWIGVQALINIGVALDVLPTKGITLPFVSRGGSSLVMCLVAVGVLMSVSREPA
ncbi:MAG: cell division protein FtsW [Microthrixaceae bacterium]|nr:cell division protein FtsW [Microthrixaceae bacterium]